VGEVIVTKGAKVSTVKVTLVEFSFAKLSFA
jgi:hypothetical protein